MKADKTKVKRQIAIAKGQLEGITKMIDQDEYCIDISNQLLATIALLKRVNNIIVSAHLSSCVLEAKDSDDVNKKLKEMEGILERMSH
jgi:DNA-binding FrmR family transcriptional regulator